MDRLDLFRFTPFRLNRLAAEVSAALASEYSERYGLDIPEWRVLATLGARETPCTAQYISRCTRTHKSTISRAVTSLMRRKLIARIADKSDGRAFTIGFTAKGRALYDELVPYLLRKDRDIMSCLNADQRRQFAAALTTIEKSLDLVQTAEGAEPY